VVSGPVTEKVPRVALDPSQVEFTWAGPVLAVSGTVSSTLNEPSFVDVLTRVVPFCTNAIVWVSAWHVTEPLTPTWEPGGPDCGEMVTVPGMGADPAGPGVRIITVAAVRAQARPAETIRTLTVLPLRNSDNRRNAGHGAASMPAVGRRYGSQHAMSTGTIGHSARLS
jgi:hypothetical protein